ncbi:hypothetical protein Btru_025729 [Bulinus truncatus]|nr:hypothetical protein Btru_025729 [Bulinus truncatus]
MVTFGPVSKHLKKSDRRPNYSELYHRNMLRMQEYLDKSFSKFFSLEQLQSELGDIMEKVTAIMAYFWELGITRKEVLCLKVILLLNHGAGCIFVSLTIVVVALAGASWFQIGSRDKI